MSRLLCFVIATYCLFMCFSCGVQGFINGGSKDSIHPVLKSSNIAYKQVNVNTKTKKLILYFNEYIDVKNQNIISVNPSFKAPLEIFFDKNYLEISLDSVKANKTYKIDLFNSISDLNEGNQLKDFSFLFSTGSVIDTFAVKGIVIDAETNIPDTNVSVVLYSVSNFDDSTVYKKNPDYIVNTKSGGFFEFTNLEPQGYRLFVLEDARNIGRYSNKKLKFGFINKQISPDTLDSSYLIRIYRNKDKSNLKIKKEYKNGKQLIEYKSNIVSNKIDLDQKLIFDLNTNPSSFNLDSLVLCDTAFVDCDTLGRYFKYDSTKKRITIDYSWSPDSTYKLIVKKGFFNDSNLYKSSSDTIVFSVPSLSKYGKSFLILPDSSACKFKNPILRVYSGGQIIFSLPIKKDTTLSPLLMAKSYRLDLIDDFNGDLEWTIGDYDKKIQPEFVYELKKEMQITEGNISYYVIEINSKF